MFRVRAPGPALSALTSFALVLALGACQLLPAAPPTPTPAAIMPTSMPTPSPAPTPTPEPTPTPTATPSPVQTPTPEPSQLAEEPPDCLSTADIALAAGGPTADADRVTFESVLDEDGAIIGYRLTIESSERGLLAVTLPPESFAAEPVGSLVVFTAYSPEQGSEVRAVDVASGCQGLLFQPTGTVRSAVLDPTGTALYVHPVSVDDRQDLGIKRFDLATGDSVQVLPPVEASDRYGPTFSTKLRWGIDDDALAVTLCGATLCRTRVLNVADGTVETYDGDDHGRLVGLTAEVLYVFDACGDVAPCTLLAIDRKSGEVSVVRKNVYEAVLVSVDGQPRLRIRTDGSEDMP